MSLYCAISGQPPLKPVLSIKSGVVYEHDLISKYIKDNGGKDPITGDELTVDDLVTIKTGEYSVSLHTLVHAQSLLPGTMQRAKTRRSKHGCSRARTGHDQSH